MVTWQEAFAGRRASGSSSPKTLCPSSVVVYMKPPLSGTCGLANVSCEYGPQKPLIVYGRIPKLDQMLPMDVTNADTS